jgi:hypothetical protein
MVCRNRQLSSASLATDNVNLLWPNGVTICVTPFGYPAHKGWAFAAYMNRCDYLDPGLVWTGVKDSGRGALLSAIGYEMLTRPKSYHLRHQI